MHVEPPPERRVLQSDFPSKRARSALPKQGALVRVAPGLFRPPQEKATEAEWRLCNLLTSLITGEFKGERWGSRSSLGCRGQRNEGGAVTPACSGLPMGMHAIWALRVLRK